MSTDDELERMDDELNQIEDDLQNELSEIDRRTREKIRSIERDADRNKNAARDRAANRKDSIRERYD